ncbi:hypothetical protein [Haliangium ochraceum]|uniref:PH domain-containing protein n=1 Tax=Haliangium ochraceum (strain DSM 14365 / JCM 11303 / SMP-2) TaxID=502025 RepID=D0LK77_HALO1|nr:hypothetical protein [Haliangium ochraceum]ACY13111.1 hypothetical protein Hoch_0470 [Haliangium ochraceum DSM 14365]
MPTTLYQFRPRYRALALGAMSLGAVLAAVGVVEAGRAATYALAGGIIGVLLGTVYLLSPVWRLRVRTDEDGLSVEHPRAAEPRFRLAWSEITRVIASAETRTCFVDGGTAERSLLVPGPGASAPYDITGKAALYQTIVERVPAERIEWVALIEQARAAEAAKAKDAADPPAGAS